jgi:hypothetical protein
MAPIRSLLALAALGLALLATGCSERTFMPRARELVAAAQAGEFPRAYRCTSARFRERVTPRRFQAVLERELDIRQAQVRSLRFGGQTSNRAGKAEGELQTRRGVLPITLALNRAVTDMDYLVDDIAVRGRSLFPELER